MDTKLAQAEGRLKKEDVPFLVEAMNRKHGLAGHTMTAAAEPLGEDKVTGDMNIPNPVEVNVQGNMSIEDYQKCSMIMAVCTNMVQQTIANAAIDAGIQISDAIRNMDAWVTGFTTFPFPFFNFKDQQDDTYVKQDFSLKADPEVVEKIVNIKNLSGLKDSVLGALKASGGELGKFSKEERTFNYFGVITGYNETDISIRVIKYGMHMKNTDAKALCVTYAQTELNSSYDTYQFIGDKYMMIKMQEAIQEKLIEKIAAKLLEFIDEFYEQQLMSFRGRIKDIILKRK